MNQVSVGKEFCIASTSLAVPYRVLTQPVNLVVSGKSKVGAPCKYPRIHQPSVPTSSLQS
ncbi:MAG: hypothetical protein NTY42_11065 [Planctomycetota bacterium]|nr:hypothetical protein [Planctomycetota bacterium]